MNIYKGTDGHQVMVNGKPLNRCLHIMEHSPAGFAWGYSGSGPAQLALAIMVHEYGRDLHNHPIHYQELKRDIIAKYDPDQNFILTTGDIQAWLARSRQAMA